MHIKTQSRVLVATLAAALSLTAVDMRPVAAASAGPQSADAKTTQASDATEFSAQRRHYRHHRHGNRAAAGAIIGAFGAIAGIAAAESARRNYYRGGYYDYGYSAPAYGYAYPAPYAYGAPYAYPRSSYPRDVDMPD